MMQGLLVWLNMGVASAEEPSRRLVRKCRARVDRVDDLFLSGAIEQAWAAAEKNGQKCKAVGKQARPGYAEHWRSRTEAFYEDGQYAKGIRLAERDALVTLASQGPEHPATATSLNNLAGFHLSVGEYAPALTLHQRALSIRQTALGPEHPSTAVSLNNLAGLYRFIGDYSSALPLLQRGLAIIESAYGPEHVETGLFLNNLGALYESMGDYSSALPLYQRALAIAEVTHGPQHPRTSLYVNNLASLHQALGDHASALPLYKRALSIVETAFDPGHPEIASSLNNLAVVYRSMGEYSSALPLYQQALAIYETALGPNHPATAAALNNLAVLYGSVGDFSSVLPLLKRSLAIYESVFGPEHHETTTSLHILSGYYREQGEVETARHYLDRALPTVMTTSDVSLRWAGFASAAQQAFAEDNLGEAVLWGKLAVTVIEQTRDDVAQLENDALESSLLGKYESTYRKLADHLAAMGRISEAEQVLELLKRDEQHRFQRRSGGAAGSVPLTPAEADWIARFNTHRDTVIADVKEYNVLRKAAARGNLSQESQARLAELKIRRDDATQAINTTLAELRAVMNDAASAERFHEMGLQDRDRIRTQRRLSQDSALLHTVILPDHLLLLLTTRDARLAERVEVSAQELNTAILAFREALQNPSSDPRPAARTLHDWLLAPIADDLERAEINTLLTYLDGTLRYIPFSALYDGERFLVERYATVVFTAASRQDQQRAPIADPAIAAFGLSEEATVGGRGFSALPSVIRELDAVVNEGGDDLGAVAGRSFLDASFTRQQLADSLSLEVPWIHIASHFLFTPGGTESDSYLVMGDGSALTAAELRSEDYPLFGVDLLAFSACDTAMGDSPRADGSEMEGLAVIAQNQGAGAVLATLWPVADTSTATWMATLYRDLEQNGERRALTVQQVQQQFLTGEISAETLSATERASRVLRLPEQPKPSEMAGWTHPYYWAPFVLYGTDL